MTSGTWSTAKKRRFRIAVGHPVAWRTGKRLRAGWRSFGSRVKQEAGL